MAGRLGELERDIRNHRAEKLDGDVEAWVNDQLADVRADAHALEGDRAFEHYVINYVAREFSRIQDHEREEPLCSCRNRCPVKEGKIPAAVRMADSLDDGIRRYKQQHVGKPVVLIEAYQAFSRDVARIETRYERIKTAMVRNEVPDDQQREGESESQDDTPGGEPRESTVQEVPADD